KPGAHRGVQGIDVFDKVIDIDQKPIGRTPRSNPATYTDLFTHIRELYSLTPEAKVRGYKPGRFSFNVRGGRCETCKGDGYIKLGQPATTLSGGEAQRVKLAAELCKVATGKTLYILDEPTTGLHFADIEKLLETLQRLVDNGNTMIVIEHNLDVIKQADWIVDLGPEGGEAGGEIVAVGTPEDVARVVGSFTGQFLRDVLPVETAVVAA